MCARCSRCATWLLLALLAAAAGACSEDGSACGDAAPDVSRELGLGDGPHVERALGDGPLADLGNDADVASGDASGPVRLFVFSRTQAFRHGSIGAGVNLIKDIAARRGWLVDHSEDATRFTATNLAQYRVVVWLNTSGDVLDSAQQTAFEGYIKAGGAYVGVHAASDTEYDWAWYGQLVGAYFKRHPQIQGATLHVETNSHPATAKLTDPWMRTDEWYDFQTNPRPNVTVLLTIDEASYSGGAMGNDHPIAWAHTFDGGRAFYTAMGHTDATYSEADFIAHLEGGIAWAAGVP
ncbi:MAG: ThuA domain-containing protein [Myxococcales bacterium]|nr:ThuA domain-containing protein [Myxococcales bacterium]